MQWEQRKPLVYAVMIAWCDCMHERSLLVGLREALSQAADMI